MLIFLFIFVPDGIVHPVLYTQDADVAAVPYRDAHLVLLETNNQLGGMELDLVVSRWNSAWPGFLIRMEIEGCLYKPQ